MSVGEGTIRFVYPDAVVDAVRKLFDAGFGPTDIARQLDLPMSTVRHWCRGEARPRGTTRETCPRSSSSVCGVARTGCREVKSYSKHWLCLFPQHGPGRKHDRPTVLERWQRDLVERNPGRLLRGLFHSDGCRIVNWTQKRTATGCTRYEYPRYLFSNKSEDILGICEEALGRLDVPFRRPRWDMISVARRQAVARLDGFVGPKY